MNPTIHNINPNFRRLELPPHGFVELLDVFGSDSRIVSAARVSYDGDSKGADADRKLLFYLYQHRHTSPFEQCNVTFRIQMPIFVMRQFVRHRTFRLNELSGRYTEYDELFFSPGIGGWRKQNTTGNKQGSAGEVDLQDTAQDIAQATYITCFSAYEELLAFGVAKEQARMVLPQALYTKIVVNCDLHNLLNFFRLRLDSHAQGEIRDVADAMAQLVRGHFPWTFEAFDRFKTVVIDREA